ncbi:MAG TPA: alpha-ketoacid dehydrogenase subunit beta [Candidatus Nanoarchaeia archaeon]|nr:alpha-ketoacid dehydrogenase subunit beta [Candidatus Nanoarchaeia archaeon]
MAERNLVQALNQALFLAFEKDPHVVVLGEDVGVDGGVFRVTDGLLAKFGEKRVIDTSIGESTIVGSALGMAINGLKPIAEIQFSGFIYPAFQQLISHVSRMRNRTRGVFGVPIVIRSPNGGGVNALEHHSESLEAVYAHIPGLKVVMPSNPYDGKGLLLAAINDPDPVLLLEPIKLYRAFKQEVPDAYYEVPIGLAQIVQAGKDITILAWGAMVLVAQDAASQVQASCEIIDLRTIMPWDKKTILESAKKTGRVVIIHEAIHTCGFGAELAATIQEECLDYLQAPIVRVTAPDVIVPYYRSEHFYRPNADMLIEKIKQTLTY